VGADYTTRDGKMIKGANMKTWEFLSEFIEALKKQLESDDKRWGNTWLQRFICP